MLSKADKIRFALERLEQCQLAAQKIIFAPVSSTEDRDVRKVLQLCSESVDMLRGITNSDDEPEFGIDLVLFAANQIADQLESMVKRREH